MVNAPDFGSKEFSGDWEFESSLGRTIELIFFLILFVGFLLSSSNLFFFFFLATSTPLNTGRKFYAGQKEFSNSASISIRLVGRADVGSHSPPTGSVHRL
jgi:hypothetical protein